MFNAKDIKKDFPIFANNNGLIFLDSAASSQRPRQVIDAVREYYEEYNANIHRGIYKLSELATARYEASRKKVADFIGAEISEIIFVRNATEGINLIAHTWGRENLKEKDEVLITQMEHHSNIVPWQLLFHKNTKIQKYKNNMQVIRLTNNHTLDLQDYKKKLQSGKVKLVAVTHVSNVLGTINPVKEMVKLAHEAGARVLIDGAQAVPHMAVDVKDIDADFYVFSGHKMLGPTGVGVLYAKRDILETIPPFIGGGDMIKEVTLEKTTYNDIPWKFEAGTPNIAGVIGLGAAINYLEKLGMKNVRAHELELNDHALKKINETEGIKLLGPRRGLRGAVFAFTIDNVHPHDAASIFNDHNIAIRAGHHCAMPLHTCLGIPASARASFYVYNTRDDVDKLINVIQKIKSIFY